MTDPMAALRARIDRAERELDESLAEWHAHAAETATGIATDLRAEQLRLRRSLLAHLRGASLLSWLTAPLIYGLIVPIVLTDLSVTLYQWACFPVYGIARVPRAAYFRIDRHLLPYLNPLEKLNCVYCGYSNGVIAYARVIAGLTEQYFCPIKHATPPAGPHTRYRRFAEYGDAQGFRDRTQPPRQDSRATDG